MVAALPAAENVDDAQSSTTAQPIALPPPCCQPQPKQLPDSGHVNTVCATQCVILGCLQCAGRVQQQAQHVPRRRQPGTPHTGVSCSPATRTRLWLASPAAVAPPPTPPPLHGGEHLHSTSTCHACVKWPTSDQDTAGPTAADCPTCGAEA